MVHRTISFFLLHRLFLFFLHHSHSISNIPAATLSPLPPSTDGSISITIHSNNGTLFDTLTILPSIEPAQAVEYFAQRAIDAGIKIDSKDMLQAMDFICAQRSCTRRQLTFPKLKRQHFYPINIQNISLWPDRYQFNITLLF